MGSQYTFWNYTSSTLYYPNASTPLLPPQDSTTPPVNVLVNAGSSITVIPPAPATSYEIILPLLNDVNNNSGVWLPVLAKVGPGMYAMLTGYYFWVSNFDQSVVFANPYHDITVAISPVSKYGILANTIPIGDTRAIVPYISGTSPAFTSAPVYASGSYAPFYQKITASGVLPAPPLVAGMPIPSGRVNVDVMLVMPSSGNYTVMVSVDDYVPSFSAREIAHMACQHVSDDDSHLMCYTSAFRKVQAAQKFL